MELNGTQKKRIGIFMAFVLLFSVIGAYWSYGGKQAKANSIMVNTFVLGTEIEIMIPDSAGTLKSCIETCGATYLKINIVFSKCNNYKIQDGEKAVSVKYYDGQGKLVHQALDNTDSGSLVVSVDGQEYKGSILLFNSALPTGTEVEDIRKIVLGDEVAETPSVPTPSPTPTPTLRPTPSPTPTPTLRPTPSPTPTPTPTLRPTPTPTPKPTITPTPVLTGNLWDGVELVIPASVEARSGAKAKIITYSFEKTAESSYKVWISFNVISKGRWNTFYSDALFYDKDGKLLNKKGGTDGFFGADNVVQGGSYKDDIRISDKNLVSSIKKIVFQEKWYSVGDWIDGKATASPSPTPAPTVKPTALPTVKPTVSPTARPTVSPTVRPTASPTVRPTASPTVRPTASPTVRPTASPTPTPVVTPVPNQTPVEKTAQSISISSSMKKTLGQTAFKIRPSGEIYTFLSFKSSNNSVASVKSYGSFGMVELHKAGKVKITIEAPETNKYKAAKKTVTLKICLGKPKVKVSVKKGRMTIQWNKVKGAEKYQVSVTQHGVKTTILPLMKKTKISNTVTKGKKYTVKVRALDSTKKYPGAWSKKTVKA